MSKLGQAAAFATSLYRERAGTAYVGYVRRDPLALLRLKPGRADPYALYERLRAIGTLTPTRPGNWASTSHRVCDSVLRDHRFGASPEGGTEDNMFDVSFLAMNPPDHTRLRRLAAPTFSPKTIATYAGTVERTVGTLLDKIRENERFDLVADLALPVPLALICDMLGIPDSDTERFCRHGMMIGSAVDGVRSPRHAAQALGAYMELQRLFEDLFELRRREPRDDVVSRLVATGEDEIKPRELAPMCFILLVGGFLTTVNLISNSVLALLDHPGQWELLRADPEEVAPMVVEETLRWDPPVQSSTRFALRDVELEGKTVRKGQQVLILIGAANRDPEVYYDPGAFNITRDNPAGNLAFASGIHYCLGQPLARLEATIALRMLAERFPNLVRSGPARRQNASVIRGPKYFPVCAGARVPSQAV